MKKKIPHFIIHHTLISCKHPVFKALRAIFFFLILAVNAKAIEVTPTGNEQDIRITGIVRDNKGEPLAGVTVKIKNSTDAVATTKEGKFAINVLSREAVLVFSFLGFETQEIKIGEQTSLNISLKSTSSNLNEIVVIGYGTAKKKDLTGSVSSIQAKELESKQFSNIQETLQGRVAGLQLTTGDASPGSSPTIRIRGTGSLGTSSDPLFVIDGYPSNEDLSSINPGDIASIDILKDASATAIYGSRGANGVILITTKKGIAGQYKIDAEAYQGVASTTNRLKLMNAREYAEYRNEVVQNTTPGSKPFASPALLDYYSAHNTDWQDALYRNAPLTNVNVSMSGGDDKSRFLLSGNYFSQDGIILNTGFKRGSLRFNFDRTISSKLKFNLTSTLTKTYNNRTLVNTSGGTAGGVVINVLRMNPTIAVYDANGKFTYKNTIQSDDASDPNATIELNGNPVAFATKNVDDNNVLRGQINTSLNYQITPELQFRTFFGVEYLANWRNTYTPNDLFEQAFFNGSASKTTNIRNNWITENYVTYNKNFNDQNSINIVAGYSYQYFKQESTLASSTNYFTNLFSYNNLSTGVSQTDNSSASQNTLQSFYSRFNAKLFTKLLLTGALRVDGSSNFGDNHKYGYFPTAALAYRLGEEKFIKNTNFINDLKLRVGYGITGNQSIPSYQSRFGYSLAPNQTNGSISGSAGRSTFGTGNYVAIAATRAENPNLQWEQTAQFNTGVDLSLFNSRVNITADYYNRRTTKLLFQISLPATTGFTTAYDNFGQLTNKGFELTLNTRPVDGGSFRWDNTLTFAINKNRIDDIGTTTSIPYGTALNIQGGGLTGSEPNFILIKPGLSVGTFTGYESAGIWQNQSEIDQSTLTAAAKANQKVGGVKYKDLNGDGKIDINDTDIIGNANPKFTGGFVNNFSYKQFDLSIFFQGQYGNKILNLNKYYTEYVVGSNKSTDILNRWTAEGTSNSLPKAGLESTRYLDNTYVENGSYLRLKSATFAYSFPGQSAFLKKLSIKNLRFYITATNLLTITKYSGYDPEVGSYNNNTFAPGIDFGAFPTAKSYIIGMKIGL